MLSDTPLMRTPIARCGERLEIRAGVQASAWG
jgi:hypothetical protein